MVSMKLEGEEKIAAAVDEFVAEAKADAGERLKNAGYAISGAAGAKMRARTHNRLHMYPSVRKIGDDVRLQNPIQRRHARRAQTRAQVARRSESYDLGQVVEGKVDLPAFLTC